MRSGTLRLLLALAASFVLTCCVAASQAKPASPSDSVSIGLLTIGLDQPGYQVLIQNFEHAYPNISVQVTYSSNESGLQQLEATELAAGAAPALLTTTPGCGATNAICSLASAGDLLPLVKQPWAKRSLPIVTSLSKHGQALYAFEPAVSPYGMFTNNALFSRLGLKVPQTFSQLLSVCRQAQADGTPAVMISGVSALGPSFVISDLAIATLYDKDRNWNAQLKAGKATFDGTQGWHEALEEFQDMSSAGCFEPGIAGTASAEANAEFAAGQALTMPNSSNVQGVLEGADPSFQYSFVPFPSETTLGQTETFINLSDSLSINAHASAQSQAAAQTFIDFVARPAQDALYARLTGGVTQYQFLKDELPSFLSSSFSPLLARDAYVARPTLSWWNAGTSLAFQDDAIGLITGQTTVDGILQAMDAAWQQGPS